MNLHFTRKKKQKREKSFKQKIENGTPKNYGHSRFHLSIALVVRWSEVFLNEKSLECYVTEKFISENGDQSSERTFYNRLEHMEIHLQICMHFAGNESNSAKIVEFIVYGRRRRRQKTYGRKIMRSILQKFLQKFIINNVVSWANSWEWRVEAETRMYEIAHRILLPIVGCSIHSRASTFQKRSFAISLGKKQKYRYALRVNTCRPHNDTLVAIQMYQKWELCDFCSAGTWVRWCCVCVAYGMRYLHSCPAAGTHTNIFHNYNISFFTVSFRWLLLHIHRSFWMRIIENPGDTCSCSRSHLFHTFFFGELSSCLFSAPPTKHNRHSGCTNNGRIHCRRVPNPRPPKMLCVNLNVSKVGCVWL